MKAVFVDRDGVINRNRPDHVKSWEEFTFLPHSVEALTELTRFGLKTVILTNQAAINRGISSRETIEEIHSKMAEVLEAAGAKIEGIFYCPHRPEESCGCRKPEPGLLFQAAEKLSIEVSQSYLIGDALSDIMAARAAGCRPILVMTGHGLSHFLSLRARRLSGYSVSRDLRHAVRRILVEERLIAPGFLERLRGLIDPIPVSLPLDSR